MLRTTAKLPPTNWPSMSTPRSGKPPRASRIPPPATPPAPQFGSLIFTANTDGVEVFVDNKSIGVAPKGKPFAVPGLAPGQHTVKGVKMGYEPDGPRQETVY